MPAINNTTNAQLSNVAPLVGKRFATEARNATQGGDNQPTIAKDGLTLSGDAKRVGKGGLGLNPADAKPARGGSETRLDLREGHRDPKPGDAVATPDQPNRGAFWAEA